MSSGNGKYRETARCWARPCIASQMATASAYGSSVADRPARAAAASSSTSTMSTSCPRSTAAPSDIASDSMAFRAFHTPPNMTR
jgi:hypothetical protein